MIEYKSIVEQEKDDSSHNWQYYVTNFTVNQYFVNKFIPVAHTKMALLGESEWMGSMSPFDTIEVMLSQDNNPYFCPSYNKDTDGNQIHHSYNIRLYAIATLAALTILSNVAFIAYAIAYHRRAVWQHVRHS
jgi:hypothetical protein